MRQKLFFLMLILFMLSAASVQAQVTIGADAPPHSAAVLDLQSDLGLKLPTVPLGDVSVFQLLEEGDEEIETAVGLMIYNSSEETTGGSGKGIYVWEGKWIFVGKSAPVAIPVTKINITSDGYKTEVRAGSNLQLTATVEPDNASNKTVIWTQIYNPATIAGGITIDDDGYVTAVKTGSVTVRATATDGSGVYRDLALTVKATGYVTGITVTPINGSSTIEVDQSLHLIATVAPPAASPIVSWSIDNPTVASISSTGLVTATATGDAIVTATATDGSLTTTDYPITVGPSTLPPLEIDVATISGVEYKTYNYNGTVWTVENMRHGTASAMYYEGDEDRPGYYYTWTQAQDVCTDGFALPTPEQFTQLGGYVHGPFATLPETRPWTSLNELTGYGTPQGSFLNWGIAARYWLSEPGRGAMYVNDYNVMLDPEQTNWFVIRCVQE